MLMSLGNTQTDIHIRLLLSFVMAQRDKDVIPADTLTVLRHLSVRLMRCFYVRSLDPWRPKEGGLPNG